jgi:hypothetical protein
MTSGPDFLAIALPLPAPGRVSMVEGAGLQLVLEQERGGLRLLSHDGLFEATHHLALPAGGALQVRWSAPEHPLAILLRDEVALAPGSRLRGYVVVPMGGRIELAGSRNGAPLLEILPTTLRLTWREGAYAHEAAVRWIRRWHRHRCGGGLVVPLVLRNLGRTPQRPARLHLAPIGAGQVRRLRDQFVAAPRRITFEADGRIRESVRPWLRRHGWDAR